VVVMPLSPKAMQSATARHNGRKRARARPNIARVPRGEIGVSNFQHILASALSSVPPKLVAMWVEAEEALGAGLYVEVLGEIVREENGLRALWAECSNLV
jgi:hypothetical protein